jgi:hypothetical protein
MPNPVITKRLFYSSRYKPQLGIYTGAILIYSLRKIDATDTKPAITVRRGSDNIQKDIYFDASGNLDIATLLAFAGSGDAFIVTWYEKSGNNKDARQTIAIDQPKIVSSGTLITQGGKPALYWNGTNKGLLTNNTLSGISLVSSFWVATPENPISSNGLGFIWAEDSNTLGRWGALGYDANSKVYAERSGALVITLGGTGTSQTARYLDSRVISLSSVSIYKNGSLLTSASTSAYGNRNSSTFTIGHRAYSTSFSQFKGYLQEVILFPSNLARSTIESDINSYYSIY